MTKNHISELNELRQNQRQSVPNFRPYGLSYTSIAIQWKYRTIYRFWFHFCFLGRSCLSKPLTICVCGYSNTTSSLVLKFDSLLITEICGCETIGYEFMGTYWIGTWNCGWILIGSFVDSWFEWKVCGGAVGTFICE